MYKDHKKLIYMYNQGSALNYVKGLICRITQPTSHLFVHFDLNSSCSCNSVSAQFSMMVNIFSVHWVLLMSFHASKNYFFKLEFFLESLVSPALFLDSIGLFQGDPVDCFHCHVPLLVFFFYLFFVLFCFVF